MSMQAQKSMNRSCSQLRMTFSMKETKEKVHEFYIYAFLDDQW